MTKITYNFTIQRTYNHKCFIIQTQSTTHAIIQQQQNVIKRKCKKDDTALSYHNMYLKYVILITYTITLFALKPQAFSNRHSGIVLARYVNYFLNEINQPIDLVVMSCWKRGKLYNSIQLFTNCKIN